MNPTQINNALEEAVSENVRFRIALQRIHLSTAAETMWKIADAALSAPSVGAATDSDKTLEEKEAGGGNTAVLQNWLSVDSLDKSKMQFVLAYQDGAMRTRLWNPRGFWEDDYGRKVEPGGECAAPTHWMELPDVPSDPEAPKSDSASGSSKSGAVRGQVEGELWEVRQKGGLVWLVDQEEALTNARSDVGRHDDLQTICDAHNASIQRLAPSQNLEEPGAAI